VYFLRPYGTRTLAGTVHRAWEPSRGLPPAVSAAEIEGFLLELNAASPELDVRPEHVVRILAGLLPVDAPGGVEVSRRPRIYEHAKEGGPRGLVAVSGVKFTTAPALARRAVDLYLPEFGRRTESAARPAPRPWISPEALTEFASRDLNAARGLVLQVIETEHVSSLDDLVLRRLDWTLVGEGGQGAINRLERLLGGETFDALSAARRSAPRPGG
jgi:glycerol-3-phosphate dehydrogenase